LPGRWKKIGNISPEDALKYVEEDVVLLHNEDKKVDPEIFKSVPKEQWKSLQLYRPRIPVLAKTLGINGSATLGIIVVITI